MERVTIIERFVAQGTLLESDKQKLPDGVLCRTRYNICNIGEKNRNGRVYEKAVWEKVLANPEIQEKLRTRSLFAHAEHPETTQSNTEKVAAVVTNIEILENEGKVYADIDVLDTPYGRICDTLLRAGCGLGVSTRAEGELEEVDEGDGKKYMRVVPDTYQFVTVDFTADPSTYGSYPEKVERDIVKTVKAGIDNEKIDRQFATVLLEHLKVPTAKKLLESLKIDKGHKDCKCKPSGKKCKTCEHKDEPVNEVTRNADIGRFISDVLQSRGITVQTITPLNAYNAVVTINSKDYDTKYEGDDLILVNRKDPGDVIKLGNAGLDAYGLEQAKKGVTEAKALPKVEYQGKKWFVDKRLEELRNVDNPHDFIKFEDIDIDDLDRILDQIEPPRDEPEQFESKVNESDAEKAHKKMEALKTALIAKAKAGKFGENFGQDKVKEFGDYLETLKLSYAEKADLKKSFDDWVSTYTPLEESEVNEAGAPTNSPWGKPDSVKEIAPGVYWVSTPGHGGMMVSMATAKDLLTSEAKARGKKYFGFYCYEEDADWAIPAYEMIEKGIGLDFFGKTTKEDVLKSLSRWNADYLQARGIEGSAEELARYKSAQEEDKLRKEKSPDLIISASSVDENPEQTKVWTADGKVYIVTGYEEEFKRANKEGGGPRLSNVKIVQDLGKEKVIPTWEVLLTTPQGKKYRLHTRAETREEAIDDALKFRKGSRIESTRLVTERRLREQTEEDFPFLAYIEDVDKLVAGGSFIKLKDIPYMESGEISISKDGELEEILITLDSHEIAQNTMEKDEALTKKCVEDFNSDDEEVGYHGGGWDEWRKKWATKQGFDVNPDYGFGSDNTYNWDDTYFWGEVFEFTSFHDPKTNQDGIIIMWHLGGDVRGNYDDPEVWIGNVEDFFSLQNINDPKSEVAYMLGYNGDYDALKKDIADYVQFTFVEEIEPDELIKMIMSKSASYSEAELKKMSQQELADLYKKIRLTKESPKQMRFDFGKGESLIRVPANQLRIFEHRQRRIASCVERIKGKVSETAYPLSPNIFSYATDTWRNVGRSHDELVQELVNKFNISKNDAELYVQVAEEEFGKVLVGEEKKNESLKAEPSINLDGKIYKINRATMELTNVADPNEVIRYWNLSLPQQQQVLKRLSENLDEKMVMMPKEIASKMPKLRSQEGKDPKDVPIMVKFFDPTGSWTWYAIEGEPTGQTIERGVFAGQPDWEFFGLVDGFEKELGYFTLGELSIAKEGAKGMQSLPIERDRHFSGKTLADVMNEKRNESVEKYSAEDKEALKQQVKEFFGVELSKQEIEELSKRLYSAEVEYEADNTAFTDFDWAQVVKRYLKELGRPFKAVSGQFERKTKGTKYQRKPLKEGIDDENFTPEEKATLKEIEELFKKVAEEMVDALKSESAKDPRFYSSITFGMVPAFRDLFRSRELDAKYMALSPDASEYAGWIFDDTFIKTIEDGGGVVWTDDNDPTVMFIGTPDGYEKWEEGANESKSEVKMRRHRIPLSGVSEAMKQIKQLRIQLAETIAEKDKAVEVMNRISESYQQDVVGLTAEFKKLKQESETKIAKLTEKVRAFELSEAMKTEALRKQAAEVKALMEAKEAGEKEMNEAKQSYTLEIDALKSEHQKQMLKKYYETVLKVSGLKLTEQAITLLSQCKSEEEIDATLAQFRKSIRENLLHFDKVSQVEVPGKTLSPDEGRILHQVGKAFSGMR